MSDHPQPGSKIAAAAAIRAALSESREEEHRLAAEGLKTGVHIAAADFGGEYITAVPKIIERAIVAAKREGVIGSSHPEEGAVAGAAREAVVQIMQKALGLNIGGKIGIARYEDHIGVCIYFGIGLLHLNEIAIGLGHRVI